jgi:predicted outer membrane lipoprotein
MKKLCLLLSISFFSWIGWKLGASFGIMTAYWLSFIGSLIGVVLGVIINQRFLDY